jgi:hypothetical protein
VPLPREERAEPEAEADADAGTDAAEAGERTSAWLSGDAHCPGMGTARPALDATVATSPSSSTAADAALAGDRNSIISRCGDVSLPFGPSTTPPPPM